MNTPATVVIENVSPLINGGRHAIKRVTGESLRIEADLFKDGHDVLAARLKWRKSGADSEWTTARMFPAENDRWWGIVLFTEVGPNEVVIEAWGDSFLSWRAEVAKKLGAGLEDLNTERHEGLRIFESAAQRAPKESPEARELQAIAAELLTGDDKFLAKLVEDPNAAALMARFPDLSLATELDPPLPVYVDREGARFAAWYEFFPRSAGGLPDRGSTFRECIDRVEDARAMGVDVIYFPPIHPIGLTKRKGPNNSLTSKPGDPGVPYAIGGPAGGHRAVEPALGTLEDFEWLVAEIHARGMEVALDFAINCSPDHPYVKAHPEWFFHRPDGTIKFAENPPKKYEDIYPLNFHTETWRELWAEMADIILFWCRHNVRIFRVDNPHTKPVAFWEYLISKVQAEFPDAIFLSEAFTRPKMMKALAKVGFTQSYTYFTWRNSAAELREYFEELTLTEMRHFFRGNLFTNTPDILPFYLQTSGRAGFMIRALLAATLSSVYGIYSGFELCESAALPGREEYLHSEKYQFKGRDWNTPGNIKDWIRRINAARQSERALRFYDNLRFHATDNPALLVYSKTTEAGENAVLCVASTDPHHVQEGYVEVPLERFGISREMPYILEDLLLDETHVWRGSWNFVRLDPHAGRPAHLFRVRPGSEPLTGAIRP